MNGGDQADFCHRWPLKSVASGKRFEKCFASAWPPAAGRFPSSFPFFRNLVWEAMT